MSKKSLATGTSPFAHLMSGFRGKRAEDERPEDEEARNARRAEEDERRKEEDARRAEEDERRQEEDARRAEEDGRDPKDPDDPEGNQDDSEQDPECDDGDNDEDDVGGMDDKEAKAFRRGLALGRARENARASRIFAHPAAAGRANVAATLAFTTRNSSAEAGRLMAAVGETPAPRGRGLSDRMGQRTELRPGANGGPSQASKPSFGDRVAAAVKKSGAR